MLYLIKKKKSKELWDAKKMNKAFEIFIHWNILYKAVGKQFSSAI